MCFIFLQALTGCQLEIATLSGRRVPLTIREVIKPNTTKRISEEGLPNPKNPATKGDLVVEFDIVFPDHLSDHAKRAISQYLP